jgi:hypothetical protein
MIRVPEWKVKPSLALGHDPKKRGAGADESLSLRLLNLIL